MSQEGLKRSPAVVQSTPVSSQTPLLPESPGVVAMEVSEDEGEALFSRVQPPLNPNVGKFLEVRRRVGESMEILTAPLGCVGFKDMFRFCSVKIHAVSKSRCRCRCTIWLFSSD